MSLLFSNAFNLDLITTIAPLSDDRKCCLGIESLTKSCKKYQELKEDIWYAIIIARSKEKDKFIDR